MAGRKLSGPKNAVTQNGRVQNFNAEDVRAAIARTEHVRDNDVWAEKALVKYIFDWKLCFESYTK